MVYIKILTILAEISKITYSVAKFSFMNFDIVKEIITYNTCFSHRIR